MLTALVSPLLTAASGAGGPWSWLKVTGRSVSHKLLHLFAKFYLSYKFQDKKTQATGGKQLKAFLTEQLKPPEILK